jgi:hypothetical protein
VSRRLRLPTFETLCDAHPLHCAWRLGGNMPEATFEIICGEERHWCKILPTHMGFQLHESPYQIPGSKLSRPWRCFMPVISLFTFLNLFGLDASLRGCRFCLIWTGSPRERDDLRNPRVRHSLIINYLFITSVLLCFPRPAWLIQSPTLCIIPGSTSPRNLRQRPVR